VSTADDLDRVLTAAGVAGGEVGPDDLRRIWRLTGQRDEALFDDFVAAVAATCEPAWEGPALEPGDLGLRYGRSQRVIRGCSWSFGSSARSGATS
jgi:hypothetical protein